MSNKRRNPPARYTLPEVVEPPNTRCFTIHVPNEPFYLAAFRGQMEALASAYAWQNDDAHTALDVAARWGSVIMGMGECGVPSEIQFRQPSNCELQYSVDGGITWLHAGNFADCASGKILDAIADGTLSPGQTQPSSPPISGLTCKEYFVTLPAGSQWPCPVPISGGYTVEVSQAQGGWYDGDIFKTWVCPNGGQYLFEECGGTPYPAEANDPLQTAGHMVLVGHYGNTWFNAMSGAYTVPQGTPATSLFLQANDGTLADNQGSITFKVTVCNNEPDTVFCQRSADPNGLNGSGDFGTLQRNTTYQFGLTLSTYYCTGYRCDILFDHAVDLTITYPQGFVPGCANWVWYQSINATTPLTGEWTGISYGNDLKTSFTGIRGLVIASTSAQTFDLTVTKIYP